NPPVGGVWGGSGCSWLLFGAHACTPMSRIDAPPVCVCARGAGCLSARCAPPPAAVFWVGVSAFVVGFCGVWGCIHAPPWGVLEPGDGGASMRPHSSWGCIHAPPFEYEGASMHPHSRVGVHPCVPTFGGVSGRLFG